MTTAAPTAPARKAQTMQWASTPPREPYGFGPTTWTWTACSRAGSSAPPDPLSDWCLRRDDGSEPIPTGTTLEIVETRPHGAMARELPQPGDLLTAALDLQSDGLFEVGS